MKNYITIKELAAFHEIDEGYLMEFIHFGIISVKKQKTNLEIHLDDVEELERAIRLRRDLEVNLQGVDIICRLRTRIVELQRELSEFKVSHDPD